MIEVKTIRAGLTLTLVNDCHLMAFIPRFGESEILGLSQHAGKSRCYCACMTRS